MHLNVADSLISSLLSASCSFKAPLSPSSCPSSARTTHPCPRPNMGPPFGGFLFVSRLASMENNKKIWAEIDLNIPLDFSFAVGALFLAVCLLLISCSSAQLRSDFYATSCPNAESIVRRVVAANAALNPIASAALLRLFFHDCQVQGCDASILLDTQPGIVSERESSSNFGIRGLWLIDAIKTTLELDCPGTVSCADVIVLAAREAVRTTGGPTIQDVPLGRRDAITASSLQASDQIPPSTSGFSEFLQVFSSKGMTLEESVAILGAHTLGVGHCESIVNRLYPSRDANMGFFFYNLLTLRCPALYNSQTIISNDPTPFVFDNQYFTQSLAQRGLFKVDSEVATDPSTSPIVNLFSSDADAFFQAFSSAFIKLSLTNVSIGDQGEVRRNCHFVN